MNKFDRITIINSIYEIGLIPIFYHNDLDIAKRIIDTCLDAGANCIEFTNRGDGADFIFANLLDFYNDHPTLKLGAGSIVDPVTAGIYIQAGANFIVGPTLNKQIAQICNIRKVAYIPGCGTVTEISNAEKLGVEFCKYFPGEIGGPEFIKNIRGPMPWTRIIPTGIGDVDEKEIKEWFEAGAAAIGLGSNLIRKDNITKGDFDSIKKDIERVIGWIRSARNK